MSSDMLNLGPFVLQLKNFNELPFALIQCPLSNIVCLRYMHPVLSETCSKMATFNFLALYPITFFLIS